MLLGIFCIANNKVRPYRKVYDTSMLHYMKKCVPGRHLPHHTKKRKCMLPRQILCFALIKN